MSSRTDLYDDVVDVTSFLARDVVKIKAKKMLSSSLSVRTELCDVEDVVVVVFVGARRS